MKIAHVSISALPASVGGLEIVVDNLVRHQRNLGHDASLITRWKQAAAAAHAPIGYPVHALPPNPKLSERPFREVGPRLPVELALAWHLMRQGFDIIHAHFLYPTAWLAQRPARLFNVPLIATAHGADINVDRSSGYGYRQHKRHDNRLHKLVPKIDAVTAISGSTYSALQKLGFDETRIHRIPNGIELERFAGKGSNTDRIRAMLDVPDGASLLLSVGKNQPSKGYHIVPDTLKRLIGMGHNVVWAIVGNGVKNLASTFTKAGVMRAVRLIESHELGESGQFPPDDLIGIYHASDAFVFPSLSEGAPLVALEAMAAGLPIIGNDVRGIADAITHENSGLLVEPNDAAALTNAIARMLTEPQLRERCIKSGLAKAAAHDWSTIAGQYVDLYRCLIERKAS